MTTGKSRLRLLPVPGLLVMGALAVAPAFAAEKHGAHQHGVAQLQVTLEGGALRIALEGPAENILGFEHAPKNEAQKKTVARAEGQLKDPGALFALPTAAGCKPQAARADIKLPPPGSRETHSEVGVEWRWECATPVALAHVDVGLFKTFPRLRELRVEMVTPQGQKAIKLRPGAARLKLGP